MSPIIAFALFVLAALSAFSLFADWGQQKSDKRLIKEIDGKYEGIVKKQVDLGFIHGGIDGPDALAIAEDTFQILQPDFESLLYHALRHDVFFGRSRYFQSPLEQIKVFKPLLLETLSKAKKESRKGKPRIKEGASGELGGLLENPQWEGNKQQLMDTFKAAVLADVRKRLLELKS